jgi:hypothetical protein
MLFISTESLQAHSTLALNSATAIMQSATSVFLTQFSRVDIIVPSRVHNQT